MMVKEKSAVSEKPDLIARNHRQIHIGIISVMCLLVVVSIKLSFDYEILRDVYAAVNTLIDIVLMAFLVMLFAFSSSNKYMQSRQNIVFSLLIAVDFLMLFCSALSYAAYGLAEMAEFIRITSSLSYMLCYISFAVLWKYQKFFYKKSVVISVSSCVIYSSAVLYTALSLVNIFTPVLFNIDKTGYYDTAYLDYATTFAWILVAVVMYVNVLISDCDLKKKIALASYEIAPAIMIILSILSNITHSNIYLPAIADVSLLFPLYIIFYSIYMEQKNEIARKEIEQVKMQTSLMLSQIQPHFLYNCLSTIAELCEEDSVLAEKATTTFADYLRENMDCIGSETTISFSDEMEHVEKYIWLEKLRFGDRVKVEYSLSCTDFRVPALSVQPLVENAIKHGICKKKGGGTVTVASRDDGKAYIITIADDGVGFDSSVKLSDERQHIGIENVRKRLQSMVSGSMRVETAPGKGTAVTITIPKGTGNI